MTPSSSTTSSRLWAWAACAFLAPALGYVVAIVGGLALVPLLGPDRGLDAKAPLLAARPALVFAGDSRAARHLDPRVAAAELGWPPSRIANIAVSGGDLPLVADLASRRPTAFREALVVLSVSAFQVNDADLLHLSGALLRRLAPWQQLLLVGPDGIRHLQHYLRVGLQEGLRPPLPAPPPPMGGFEYGDGVLQPFDLAELRTNPWYEPWRPDGYKRQILEASLRDLKGRSRAIMVYNGPLAPGYRAIGELEVHHRREAEHAARLAALCAELGIVFHDYRALPELTDAHFYNASHLNYQGAGRFTARVIADLRAEGLLPPSP